MYRDKTLIPTEAVRLCALGILSEGRKSYAELAQEVRHFASRIVGPSLDVLGPSIELLRYEGLAEVVEEGESPADSILAVTEAGRRELLDLMRSNVRTPVDDINKLVIALKFRFLDLLPADERRAQIDGLIDLCHNERARLSDLLAHPAAGRGHLAAWLRHDIGQIDSRIAWLEEYRDAL